MNTCKEFWNMRAQNYDTQTGPQYEKAYEKTVEKTLGYLSPDDRVLDFACGTGIVTFQMAPHAARVQAIDISDEMVRHCSEKAAAPGADNVTVAQMDLFDPSLVPGSFDVVTAFNVLCYVEDCPGVLTRIHSLLRPGGMFLSATDCLGERITKAGVKKFWKSHTGSMPHVTFFRMHGLEEAIARAGFSVLDRETLFPAPPNLFVAAKKEGDR